MIHLLNNLNLNVLFIGMGALLGVMLLPRPLEFLMKAAVHGVLGLAVLFGLNFFLVPMGMGVGVNVITLGVATLLGIPGVVSLYILEAFIL